MESTRHLEQDLEEVCWICLESSAQGEELLKPCACPRYVHKRCLAKWQLQSAGKSEETSCRFCKQVLPSWKDSLTPKDLPLAVPVVSVHYNGRSHKLRVQPGPDGLQQFVRQLQQITGMTTLECMQVTFQCKAPDTAQDLCFKGLSAFDAAIHCASISAAERARVKEALRSQSATPQQPVNAPMNGLDSGSQSSSISYRRPYHTHQGFSQPSQHAAPTTVPTRHTSYHIPAAYGQPTSVSASVPHTVFNNSSLPAVSHQQPSHPSASLPHQSRLDRGSTDSASTLSSTHADAGAQAHDAAQLHRADSACILHPRTQSKLASRVSWLRNMVCGFFHHH